MYRRVSPAAAQSLRDRPPRRRSPTAFAGRLDRPAVLRGGARGLGSGLIDPEDEDGREGDGGDEGFGATVVAGVDAAPVLEACEHVLDLVTTAVEIEIVWVLDAPSALRRDAWGDAAIGEGLAEPLRVICTVGEQGPGGRQGGDQRLGAPVIAALPLSEMEAQRSAIAVAYHMQLAGQPAPATSDTSG